MTDYSLPFYTKLNEGYSAILTPMMPSKNPKYFGVELQQKDRDEAGLFRERTRDCFSLGVLKYLPGTHTFPTLGPISGMPAMWGTKINIRISKCVVKSLCLN
jgi:hypothetical protein